MRPGPGTVPRLTLLLAFLIAAPPGTVAARALLPQSGEATLSGTVAEVGSSQPISSALVRLIDVERSATTNAVGRFTLSGVGPGTHTVEVSALGYRTDTLQVAVSPGEETSLSVALESAPLDVGRVVVTATKTARSSLEVAALTTAVDAEDVAARGDLELVDALQNEVGLVHTAQAGSFESIELRGMPRGGNEFETTLLLVDGVPQTDSRNSARVVNLPIDHADAVEVVRGPNSALYGRTAIGGAINVITASPTATPRATATLQVGGFGHRRTALSASGPAGSWAGYYVSWSSTRNEGFYDRDADYDVDETSVFGKLTFTPDSRSEAMLSLNAVVSDNSIPTGVPVIGGQVLSDLVPQYGLLDNINLPTANYHHDEIRLTATYRRDLGSSASVENIFGYRDLENAFEESGDILGSPFDLATNTLTMYPFSVDTDENVLYEELRFRVRPPLGALDNELLIGASYERTTGYRAGDLIYTDDATFGMPIDFLNPVPPPRGSWQYEPFGGDDYALDALGLYFQYRVALHPRLELTGAGRYDRLALENTETFQAGTPSIDETFDAFSPKLSALVHVLDDTPVGGLGGVDLNLYATWSGAFKPPRVPSSLNPAGTDPPLDPEDITNFEIGAKSAFADGRASLQATWFHMKRDGIVVSTRQGPLFVPSNAGSQKFDGVEIATSWTPVPALELEASAALYRNRFDDFVIQTSGGDTELSGNRLPLVPDRILDFGATWEPLEGTGLTLGLEHVGERYLDQQNTFLLDSYVLVDASVYWSRGPLRLTLAAHNLFDERYFANGDTSLAESIEPGAPRQLVLGVGFTLE